MITGMILSAVVLDWFFSDPPSRWHPVRWIGLLISALERALRGVGLSGRFGGVLLTVFAFSLGLAPAAAVWMAHPSPAWRFFSGALLIYFSIALSSLIREGRRIREALQAGKIDAARGGVAKICGRDVSGLDHSKLTLATVESISENCVDAFTAPLFFAALFGPLGAWGYRIINTLDSMVGYKQEPYRTFGWASARMDDAANFVPARLTAVFLSLGSPLVSGRVRDGFRSIRLFASLHPSPNAGWPESAAAGALGLTLGGPAVYFGQKVDKPFLGDGARLPTPVDIAAASKLAVFASLVFTALSALAAFLLS